MQRTTFTAICLGMLLSAGILPLGLLRADSSGADPTGAVPTGPSQKPSARKSAATNPNPKHKLPQGITPEREAAVRTFVERNHPELVGLLELLRTNQPKEYERAIRELHRVTERLAGVQERDSQLYDLEIQAWQVHSRIQLLTARLKMAASDDVRRDLQAAIGEQLDVRAALLRHERQRVSDRLSRIEADLAKLDGDRSPLVEKQFEMLTRSAGVAKGKSKTAGKATASKKAADKSSDAKPETKATAAPLETNSKAKS